MLTLPSLELLVLLRDSKPTFEFVSKFESTFKNFNSNFSPIQKHFFVLQASFYYFNILKMAKNINISELKKDIKVDKIDTLEVYQILNAARYCCFEYVKAANDDKTQPQILELLKIEDLEPSDSNLIHSNDDIDPNDQFVKTLKNHLLHLMCSEDF